MLLMLFKEALTLLPGCPPGAGSQRILHRKSAVPTQRYFHLHLVSDATGETLVAVGRAAAAQYKHSHAIEHIHSVVRTQALTERALAEIEQAPGIVLYTLVDHTLATILENGCRRLGVPCLSILEPVLTAFQ